jgi:hypothetical protein
MRHSLTLLAGVALLALPLAAQARIADEYCTNNSGLSQAMRMEHSTASMPLCPYVSGDAYIVNPTDMTNTRDNRGDIVQQTAAPAYRTYRGDNWDGQTMRSNTSYRPGAD